MNFLKNYAEKTMEWNITIEIVVFSLIFLSLVFLWFFRKFIQKINPKYTKSVLITLGILTILHELLFDISQIYNFQDGVGNVIIGKYHLDPTKGNQMLKVLQDNLELCRFNMYAVGIGLIVAAIFNKKFLLWIAGPAFFGGISTIFDGWLEDGSARVHSVLTHVLFLIIIPAFGITILKWNFTKKDLLWTFIFNLSLTSFIILYNYFIGTGHAVLSIKYLKNNNVTSWAVDVWKPFGFIFWISLVSFFEIIWFTIYRWLFKKDLSSEQKGKYNVNKNKKTRMNIRK